MRGGGDEGGCERRSPRCSQAAQCGFRVRPAKGWSSRLHFGRGGGGARGVWHPAAESLGHTPWSMTHSHTSTISVSWEKHRGDTMAKLPHTRAAMRVFYPVCQVAE